MAFIFSLLILVSASVTVSANDHEILEPIPEPSIGEYGPGVNGDMELTPEQQAAMNERKAAKSPPFTYWTIVSPNIGPIVPYTFEDSTISQSDVLAGIADWESNTCVQFSSEASSYSSSPHLRFTHSTSGCSSNIGMINNNNGQAIKLTVGCGQTLGTVSHEIGHAMGFWHEQSRSDRDTYVRIALENVVSESAHNFDLQDTDNFGVPYDYSSTMHYGSTGFSTNGLNTIETLNILAQDIIGRRTGLSFMDIRMANLMYGCIDGWTAACVGAPPTCENFGFVGENCNCVCPVGTSGQLCETLSLPYTEAVINDLYPNNKLETSEGTLTSPGFPTPWQAATDQIVHIVAPACMTVQLTLTVFELYDHSSCSIDYVEVVHGTSMWDAGTKICGTSHVGDVYTSVTNEMVVKFHGYDYVNGASFQNSNIGFSATVVFIPGPTCTTQPPTAPPTTPPTPIIDLTTPTVLTVRKYRPCRRKIINSSTVEILSPRKRRGVCTIKMSTKQLSLLKITPLVLNLAASEDLVLRAANRRNIKLSGTTDLSPIYLPSSELILFYSSAVTARRLTFRLRIQSMKNPCQQKIVLQPGDPPITIGFPDTPYPGMSMCEWQIVAPRLRKVAMDFNSLDVGTATTGCVNSDFVAVALSGDTKFVQNTNVYCGQSAPASTLVSNKRQLRVLANGLDGGNGFSATVRITT